METATHEPLLTPAELAERFRRTPATIRLWRRRGLRPIGGVFTRPLYRESDVLAFLSDDTPHTGARR